MILTILENFDCDISEFCNFQRLKFTKIRIGTVKISKVDSFGTKLISRKKSEYLAENFQNFQAVSIWSENNKSCDFSNLSLALFNYKKYSLIIIHLPHIFDLTIKSHFSLLDRHGSP